MNIPIHIAPDKRSVVVAETTTVEWSYEGQTLRRTLPEGYTARPGATLLTLLVLPLSTYPLALWQAAVLHDYLYDERERRPSEAVPRAVADAALLADEDDPRWLTWVAWSVVRAVGWLVW